MNKIELIKSILAIGGFSTLTVIVLLVYLFSRPEKFLHWMSIFHKGGLWFSSIFPVLRQHFDHRAVASSIEDTINGESEKLNKQASDIFPHTVKIQWVRTNDPSYLIKKEGRMILRLRRYSDQSKNIVTATLYYLRVGFVPSGKLYLDELLQKACEYRIAAKIFDSRRDTNAFEYFIEHELTPTLEVQPNLRLDIQLLENIDSKGFFTHVFLRELKYATAKMMGALPTPDMQRELRTFAQFLHTIATKDWREDVPLTFDGIKVRVAVVLVARSDVIGQYGIQPYVRRIIKRARSGYEFIYVAAWGGEYFRRVLEIKQEVQKSVVTVLHRYSLAQQQGILLVCQSNASFISRQRELENQVKQAMSDIVPEIKSGEVQIASIARIPGVGCKIAVRMAPENPSRSAVGICVGVGGARARELSDTLGEDVSIVHWVEDTKEFIVNALWPMEDYHVRLLEVDEEQLIANVVVRYKYAFNKALGRNNSNLKLAMELTNFSINVEDSSKRKISLWSDSHTELKKALQDIIPEIQRNEVKIVRLSRIPRVGSKVVVRWSYDKQRSRPASEVCSQRLNELREKIGGEYIHFHEWSEDIEELIIKSLFPLKKRDVECIQLDEENRIATIKISETTESSSVWRNRFNLRLAQEVTDWTLVFE